MLVLKAAILLSALGFVAEVFVVRPPPVHVLGLG